MMMRWTLIGGIALVCMVLVVVTMVVVLARRFRREQRGFPAIPLDPPSRDEQTRDPGA